MSLSRAAVNCRFPGSDVVRGLVLLAVLATPGAAQQSRRPGPLASNVAQVQLLVVVPPRVTLESPGAIRELDHTPSTRLLAAPLGVSVNVPHRILIQRVPDACQSADGTARHVSVRMPDGRFAELTDRPTAIAWGAQPGSVPANAVLQYQVSAASAPCDVPLPVRYEIEVAPTL